MKLLVYYLYLKEHGFPFPNIDELLTYGTAAFIVAGFVAFMLFLAVKWDD